MAPGHYLSYCRLKEAQEILLSRRDLSVTQVALACGFGSGQYFSKLFRESLGLTPGEYRRETPEEPPSN
jgi:transcriptional regulator GlxA family with amidase domain